MSSSNREGRNLYRDPQRGKIAGVCAGLAEYFGVETWIVRLLAISGLIFAGFITFTAYIAAWFLLDKKPVTLYRGAGGGFCRGAHEGAQLAGGGHPPSGARPHRPGARHARASDCSASRSW